MTKAISPKDVAKIKASSFPDWVFEAFNELIAKKYTCGQATIYQDDVIDLILQKANKGVFDDEGRLNRSQIFKLGYLNVEEVYREQGWKVTYDKPAYNETYKASFEFKG